MGDPDRDLAWEQASTRAGGVGYPEGHGRGRGPAQLPGEHRPAIATEAERLHVEAATESIFPVAGGGDLLRPHGPCMLPLIKPKFASAATPLPITDRLPRKGASYFGTEFVAKERKSSVKSSQTVWPAMQQVHAESSGTAITSKIKYSFDVFVKCTVYQWFISFISIYGFKSE